MDNDTDITQLFRNVFSSQEGKLVLSYILYEAGTFSSNSQSLDTKNFGSRLIEIMGYDRVDVSTVTRLVEGLKMQSILRKG